MNVTSGNTPVFGKLYLPTAGIYYLKIAARPTGLPFVRIWIDNAQSRPQFIPASSHTIYQIKTHKSGTELLFDHGEITIEIFRPWRLTDSPKLLIRHDLRRFSQVDCGDQLTIAPLFRLSGQNGLEVARTMRTLFNWGFGPSTPSLQDTLLYETMEHPRSGEKTLSGDIPSIGIVIHLYYPDLWPDFEKRLALISLPFKPIITLTTDNPAVSQHIKARWPHAEVLVYPNRGRDVGPFIQLWRDGHLDQFDLICKLHGKKTSSSGPRAAFGEVWRRASLNDLIGSDALVADIVRRFVQQKQLGMIGPGRLHFPNEFKKIYGDTWCGNEKNTLELVKTMGFPEQELRLDFFAGTMFWMRRELLDLLKPLNLSQDSFEEEAGQLDGTLHHALERLFGLLPSLAKNKMTTADSVWRSHFG